MRVVKFRGLSKDVKSRQKMIFGHYHQRSSSSWIIVTLSYLKDGITPCKQEEIEVLPKTVGQFIGLQDKNGVDIYEGDYLVDSYPVDDEDESKGTHESLMPVVLCDKKLIWSIDTSHSKNGKNLVSLIEYFGSNPEVKGNIHQSK